MLVWAIASQKGGVGKTTNSVMTAYQLAKLGYKTLVCDLDPQANATQLLRRTYGLQHGTDLQINKTMMSVIKTFSATFLFSISKTSSTGNYNISAITLTFIT